MSVSCPVHWNKQGWVMLKTTFSLSWTLTEGDTPR
jgi:hypothetical protein